MIADELKTALSLLTRIPTPPTDDHALGRSCAHFPLVGVALAMVHAAMLALLDGIGIPAVINACLSVTALLMLTGALHLDGLADTVDGFGGGRTHESALRIMRDSSVGSFGAAALFLALMLRISATAALVDAPRSWAVLMAVFASSRAALVWLGQTLPYARPGHGLGRIVTDFAGARELAVATLAAGTVAVWGLGMWPAITLAMVLTLLTWVVGAISRRKIGGVTGDVLGANVEICEVFGLVLMAWLHG